MKCFTLLVAAAGVACAADFYTGQAARLVIGQPNFTRQEPLPPQTVLGAVSGLAFANNTLFAADSSRVPASPQNNRVLIYQNLSDEVPAPLARFQNTTARCPACVGQPDVVVGQPDFEKTGSGLSRNQVRNPTAVASDGQVLAVADTDNNRVLIWLNIPTGNGAPADVVVGQPDFTSAGLNFGGAGNTPSAKGLRGPQGVWIQDGRLYVADTLNHRVLVWNRIPTANGADANLVLGQPNFTTFVQTDLTQTSVDAKATNLLNPVSVTSDGTRLYVTDLGHNRVLVWNTIPTQNTEPADFALGQPRVDSIVGIDAAVANNSRLLCASTGQDANGADQYPPLCAATLNFPRYALSDGKSLFIADGGNDRVLVYSSIPRRSGEPADVVLGQLSDTLVQDTGDRISAADSFRTPTSLAWDGGNLYVSDTFNRRIAVYTPADQQLPLTGIRNAASKDIFSVGSVTFGADPKENDEVTLKIGEMEYKYKAGTGGGTIADVINTLVEQVNGGAGDPLAFASPNLVFNSIILTARVSGVAGDEVAFSVTLSAGAQITAITSGATLKGGQDAAKIAPGTLVTVLGDNLASTTASSGNVDVLPTTLGGVQVYFDGMPAPLLFVSPGQINAQIPWEVSDAYSSSAYVRTTDAQGNPRITSAIGVPVIPQNPGIFAESGVDPRPAIVLHGSSAATGVVSVDGGIKANDLATVAIEDREYSYPVKAEDTLTTIRDALVALINNDEKVEAVASTVFTRIVLRARAPGVEGEGIAYSARVSDGANLILSALGSALCCSAPEGSPVTEQNPARPGETIIVYATGLGFIQPDEAKVTVVTGGKYTGPERNYPNSPIDAIAGGKTANVLFAGLKPGTIGMYELRLQLNSDIPTNPQTQPTIAQEVFISNIVAFAVVNPNPPPEE